MAKIHSQLFAPEKKGHTFVGTQRGSLTACVDKNARMKRVSRIIACLTFVVKENAKVM